MKKEKTVVMLPTEKASHISSHKHGNPLEFSKEIPYALNIQFQHLYILSDEEPKINDWCYGMDGIFQYKGKVNIDNGKLPNKIIATTNPELWIHKETIIGNERNIEQVGIPKISLDFVERFVKEFNKGNKIEKVMLQYENIGGFCNEVWKLKIRSNGSIIISPVEEKIYSKHDLNVAIREAIMYPEKFMTGICHDDKKSLGWIENELKLISK